MNRNVTVALVVVALLVLAAVMYSRSQRNQNITSTLASPTPLASVAGSASPQASSQEFLVSVTSTGFSPKEVTVKAGESVTWVNSDSAPHQVNSNPHPTHTLYPPLNTVGLLNPGDKKSLTFPTPGNYGYHDHLNPQNKGTIIVQ